MLNGLKFEGFKTVETTEKRKDKGKNKRIMIGIRGGEKISRNSF